PATLGFVTNNTTKDGFNGFPIPADAVRGAADHIGSLAMSRSVYDLATGTDADHPRQQTNVNTAFLDLSQVYGSTTAVASILRASTGGLLKSSPGVDGITGNGDDLLPFVGDFTSTEKATLNMANDSHVVSDDALFAAGDVRANETTELTSLHTLFLRN